MARLKPYPFKAPRAASKLLVPSESDCRGGPGGDDEVLRGGSVELTMGICRGAGSGLHEVVEHG